MTVVKPVLTAEEWANAENQVLYCGVSSCPDIAARQIALANYVLPGDDPRKIGWDYVDRIRRAGQEKIDTAEWQQQLAVGTVLDQAPDLSAALTLMADGLALVKIADILAAYLPPREAPLTADG